MTEMFLDGLARRGHVPWLEHEHGRLRLEVVFGECVRQWTVIFDDGDIAVSQDESDADGVLRADHVLFDRAVCGEENTLAAWLRGEISYTGSIELLAELGRLFPGPPGQKGPRKVGDKGRQTG